MALGARESISVHPQPRRYEDIIRLPGDQINNCGLEGGWVVGVRTAFNIWMLQLELKSEVLCHQINISKHLSCLSRDECIIMELFAKPHLPLKIHSYLWNLFSKSSYLWKSCSQGSPPQCGPQIIVLKISIGASTLIFAARESKLLILTFHNPPEVL